MTEETYNRLKVTTKNGLVFEIILANWLGGGTYEFGKVDIIETLSEEQKADYINVIKSLFEIYGDEGD
jgi:hypothetical protein